MYEKIRRLVSENTKIAYDSSSGKYFGNCPFCHGRTETFTVDEENGTFFCYACGASGNKKEFQSKQEPKNSTLVNTQKDPILLQIYEEAAYFYYTKLIKADSPGHAYLAKRGIAPGKIQEYGLGFAPDAFCPLYNHMIRLYKHEDLMRSGLFKLSAKDYPYDFFRNRLMFPIMDENGDVIAFGGRVLDDSRPKYINSPETVIFSKRRNLYGFPYRQDRRGHCLLICEGYMDYIAVHSSGFLDVAAVLGTALTEDHGRLIATYYRKILLAMDSDEAGIYAARKSIEILKNAGIEVRVLDLKPYKDPDEFIKENIAGVAGFRKRMESALPSHMFLARHIKDARELIDILMQQVV